MNERDIKDEINKKVENTSISNKHPPLAEKYRYWYIGITDNPDERKASHKGKGVDVAHWRSWPASTEDIARRVESHFQRQGMKGDTGGGKTPKYVYIY